MTSTRDELRETLAISEAELTRLRQLLEEIETRQHDGFDDVIRAIRIKGAIGSLTVEISHTKQHLARDSI